MFKSFITNSTSPLYRTLTLPLIVAALFSSVHARAGIVPTLDVSKLAQEAQIIVVGQVTILREEERGTYDFQGVRQPGRRMAAALRVNRVLKGEATKDLNIKYIQFDVMNGFTNLSGDAFGMFFLHSNSREITFASPHYPSIIATRDGCGDEKRSEALARIVAELACVILSSDSSISERYTAMNALGSVHTPQATEVFKRAARELSAPLNVASASALLSRGDLSEFALIEQALGNSSTLVIEDKGFHAGVFLHRALEQLKDPAAIDALARLLNSSDVEVRRSAARGLRSINTKAIIKLIATALSDDDWEVRWLAVMGLAGVIGADAEGNSWYPSYDAFRQDEQHYLNYWRERVKRY